MFESSGIQIFTIAGIPVGVSLTFLLIGGFLLYQLGPLLGLATVLAVFISILIHELGHGLVAKRYRLSPSILIHGFGGLCFHMPAPTDRQDAWIVAAGPLLQIVAGLPMLAALLFVPWQELAGTAGVDFAYQFAAAFTFFSIVWGGINLVIPIWPLDGGRLLNLLLRRFTHESTARIWTLRVSMTALVLATIFAVMFLQGSIFLYIILFMLFMQNYQALQSGRPITPRAASAGAPAKMSAFAKELLGDAEAAFKAKDWEEAARLCHQVRHTASSIPEKKLLRIWAILGLANTELGEWDEAMRYLRRAKQTAEIEAAIAKCKDELGEW